MGVAARTVVKIVVKTPPTEGQAQPASGSEEEGRHGSTGVSRPSPESARSEGLVGTSGSSVTSAGGIPESVTLVTDLLRDPGGKEEK